MIGPISGIGCKGLHPAPPREASDWDVTESISLYEDMGLVRKGNGFTDGTFPAYPNNFLLLSERLDLNFILHSGLLLLTYNRFLW
jgi:hypothetical protein